MPSKIFKKPQRRLPRNFKKYCLQRTGYLCRLDIYKNSFCKKHYKEWDKKLNELTLNNNY